ncbi:MAG: TIGR04141 family sporadically distributed protein [Candidatus Cloacimonetes bacterium]|nr:TIGR04141 family sporadically distributed protein [Candidatus Cloacimonadota bacterium]
MVDTGQSSIPSINIYLIREAIYREKKDKLTAVRLVIIDEYNKAGHKTEHYQPYDTNEENSLLFHQKRNIALRWSKYLQPITSQSLDFENTIHSFILFLLIKNQVFAVVGGHGYHVISKHIDGEFSKSIIEKTFDKSSSVFKYLQDRSLVGNVIGTSKIFRSNANLAVEEDYGKLFDKTIASIGKDQLELLGLKSKRGCSCFAGSGFRLSASISIKETIGLCHKLRDRLNEPNKMNLNDIDEEKDVVKIARLERTLFEMIKDVASGKCEGSEFDFVGKDLFKFITAEALCIRKGREDLMIGLSPTISASDILIGLRPEIDQCVDDDELKSLLASIKVISYNESVETPITKGDLIEHLHGEVTMNNGVWFLINGKWLKLNRDISTELNTYIDDNFKHVTEDWMVEPYNKHSLKVDYATWKQVKVSSLTTKTHIPYELMYNRKYLNYPKTLVVDRVFYDGNEKVELCDIMQLTADKLILVHVKTDFGASIRDVTEQIVTSASVLLSWRKNHESAKIDAYYDQLARMYKDKYKIGKPRISKADFKKTLLKRKKVQYVLAFIDSKKEVDFKIAKYRSVLAKIAIMNATKRLVDLGFELKLIRIRET